MIVVRLFVLGIAILSPCYVASFARSRSTSLSSLVTKHHHNPNLYKHYLVVTKQRQKRNILSKAPLCVDGKSMMTSCQATATGGDGVHSSETDKDVLKKWADQNGVTFGTHVSLAATRNKKDKGTETAKNQDWGVVVDQSSSSSLQASTNVLQVPKNLVLDSQDLLEEYTKNLKGFEQALDALRDDNLQDQIPLFVLWLKILQEYDPSTNTNKSKSMWEPWLQSLPPPDSFLTGITMNQMELDCLPPFAYALADFETAKFNSFRRARASLHEEEDKEFWKTPTAKWAYNIVMSRCWKYDEPNDGNADSINADNRFKIVPLGDMFNHREPANVVVQDYPQSDAIQFVLSKDMNVNDDGKEAADTDRITTDDYDSENNNTGLYLSYGMTNPHRFLVIFGFVDETMPEIFCQVLFTDASDQMIDLGCNDRSKMVYRTEDGAIANTVWDSVLYSILAQQKPDEAQLFYEACCDVVNAPTKKAALHDKYSLETCLTLRSHVVGTLDEIDVLVDQTNCAIQEEQSSSLQRLHLILEHNEFLQRTFKKVKLRLDRIEEKERAVRWREKVLKDSANK